jgi:hypothetical protein
VIDLDLKNQGIKNIRDPDIEGLAIWYLHYKPVLPAEFGPLFGYKV